MNYDQSVLQTRPVNVAAPEEDAVPKKKRNYSRGGCRECKRRKIKCDEVKPTCFQCARLQKDCAYPVFGERVDRGPKNAATPSLSIRQYDPQSVDKSDSLGKVVSENFESVSFSIPSVPSTNECVPLLDERYSTFNLNDLNVLASDLSNIVNDIMFPDCHPTYAHATEFTSDSASSLSSRNTGPGKKLGISKEDRATSVDQATAPRNIPLDYIKTSKPQEAFYLEEFYNDFSNIINPLHAWDEDLQSYLNPARDIIITYAAMESYLLAAVLAQGARTAFKKNQLTEDEDAYREYLSRCLHLLGPALTDNQDLTANIEVVLLTVLLLTCANAANTKQNWRPHLRGAKDILLKITSNAEFSKSRVLIFCKYWFVSFEVLAGLSSKLGGTLKTENELFTLLGGQTDHELEALHEMGLVTKDGFNLMGGYHNDCLVFFRDFLREKEMKRQGMNGCYDKYMEYLRLLECFRKALDTEFVSKEGRVRIDKFEDGKVPRGQLLDIVKEDGEVYVLSWKDILHQTYMLASIITLLTSFVGMDYKSFLVQSFHKQLLNLISYTNEGRFEYLRAENTKFKLILFQWPMLVAGFNNCEKGERFQVMKFFRLAAQLGSGSAGYALRKLGRKWNDQDKGKAARASSDDELDMVTY